MPESIQHKLDRVRPPRVQITYDVEIGGAIVQKELPLVVGVLADLSGTPEIPLPRLRDRKFVEIDRDNFNDVLAAAQPQLTVVADNKLTNDGKKIAAPLKFTNIDDFTPLSVLGQMKPLSDLFASRQRLTDLIGKLDGNDALDTLLQKIAKSPDDMKKIQGATTQILADASKKENGNA